MIVLNSCLDVKSYSCSAHVARSPQNWNIYIVSCGLWEQYTGSSERVACAITQAPIILKILRQHSMRILQNVVKVPNISK